MQQVAQAIFQVFCRKPPETSSFSINLDTSPSSWFFFSLIWIDWKQKRHHKMHKLLENAMEQLHKCYKTQKTQSNLCKESNGHAKKQSTEYKMKILQ